MDKLQTLSYSLIFLIGFLSCLFVFYLFSYIGLEKPLGFSFSSNESAPGDWVNEGDILVYNDRVEIRVNNASLSNYAPTGSMKPVLDENSNGIRIKPTSEEDIEVGDIITFKRGKDLIVHRVLEKGEDEEGVYFITQGDNADFDDGKTRFLEIEYITIGVIW